MKTSWFPIYYFGLIILMMLILRRRAVWRLIIAKRRVKRSMGDMTNEILKKYLGKNCFITTGLFGTGILGVISDIHENWLEIKTKKDIQLVNAEFVQSIKVMDR